MLVFATLYLLWEIAIARQQESSCATLTYPLTDMDEAIVTQFGIESSNNWKDFMNSDITWGEFKKRCDYKWSPQMVNTVDGVPYKNWGQFQSYTMHLRNIFKSGSVVITEANTTVINETTLNVYFCVVFNLSVSVGGYEPFTSINKCINRRHYFDGDMELIRSELTSEGMGNMLMNYAVQSVLTAVLPDQYVDDGVNKVWNNPVLLSMVVMILLGTTVIGCVICIVFSKKGIMYTKVSIESESDTDEVTDRK